MYGQQNVKILIHVSVLVVIKSSGRPLRCLLTNYVIFCNVVTYCFEHRKLKKRTGYIQLYVLQHDLCNSIAIYMQFLSK